MNETEKREERSVHPSMAQRRPMPHPPAQTIDLMTLLGSMWKIFRQMWIGMILLALVIAGGTIAFQIVSFQPIYQSYVTYAVSKGDNSTEDISLASRINSSFSYLVWSSGIYYTLYEKLGILLSADMPIVLSSDYVTDTNFVTINATAHNETQVIEAIDIVIENFDTMAGTVVGNAEYSIIDKSGTTELQINEFSLLRFIAIGLILGFGLVGLILFLLAYTSDSVRGYDDLRRQISVQNVGSIPLIRLQKRKKAAAALLSLSNDRVPGQFREAIYQIRSRVEKEMREQGLTTILVTSSVPGEGKTTVSLNLAIAMAERGARVLVMDCDLRNPSLARNAGILHPAREIPDKKGILDILEGKANMNEALLKLGPNLPDLIVGTRSVGRTSAYLTSESMEKLIENASAHYDYVLLDTPPSAMMTDASILAQYADSLVYVIRQDYTRVKSIREGLTLLGHSNITTLGCIFNCVQGTIGKYGYNRYSGYGRYKKGAAYGYGEMPAD